MFILIIC